MNGVLSPSALSLRKALATINPLLLVQLESTFLILHTVHPQALDDGEQSITGMQEQEQETDPDLVMHQSDMDPELLEPIEIDLCKAPDQSDAPVIPTWTNEPYL